MIRAQRGVFSIELVFVLFGMGMFLFFIYDAGYQVVQRSQLNRISYALVSVLKERSAFYSQGRKDIVWNIGQDQAQQLHEMAERLLREEDAQIRVSISRKTGEQSEQTLFAGSGAIPCHPAPVDNSLTYGGKFPLNVYRVTVCRRIPAFFETVMPGSAGAGNRIIQSTSLFVGR